MAAHDVPSNFVFDVADATHAAFLYRAVWEVATDAMVLSDADGRVLAVNPAYCDLYSRTRQELVGRSFAVIFPEEQRPRAEAEYRRYFVDQVNPHGVEARVQAGDGTELLVDVRYNFIERDGQRVAMLSVIRDVTERSRLQESERELLREKDTFLLAVSHDLKTPITAIKGHAQLLLRHLRRTEDAASTPLSSGLRQIETAATRMSRMIDGLLDASSMRSSEGTLHRRHFDLAALIREVIEDQFETADRDRLLVGAAHPVVGSWDRDRIERVVANLLSNALKYSPGGGTVDVWLHIEEGSTGAEALLTVKDRGIGISEHDLGRIFEPYYRGKNVADDIPGSGIGLAGVRHIVRLHGGTISVESAEHKGSTFVVRLPVGDVSEAN